MLLSAPQLIILTLFSLAGELKKIQLLNDLFMVKVLLLAKKTLNIDMYGLIKKVLLVFIPDYNQWGGGKKKKTKAGQIVNYGLNNKSMIATDAHMLGAWEKRKTLLWQTNKNPNWQHMYISLIM